MSRLDKYPKSIRKLIGVFLNEAYQSELHRELSHLENHFKDWCDGKIDNDDLTNFIHQFHDQDVRDLNKRYNGDFPDLVVAYAFAKEILDKKEAPKELIEALSELIKDVEDYDDY